MGIGAVEMLVLLGVCVLAILVARKSSWKTLVAVPLALLVLLGSFTIVWSVVAPRQVYYSPYDVVVPAVQTSTSDPVYETFNLNVETYDPVSETFNANGARNRVAMQPSRVQNMNGPSVRGFSLGMMLVFGVILAATIAARRWFAGNDKRVVSVFAVAGAFMVLLTLGLLFVVGGTWAFRASSRQMPATVLYPPPPPPVSVAVADLAAVEPTAEASATEVAVPESPVTPPAELPEWARGTVVNDRDLRHWAPRNPVVLVSDQWSSMPESEIQLENLAARALRRQLQLAQGPSFDWRPSKDFIHQSGAIQRRFTRETTLKVGEFESPMYQTYWEVSATPQVSNWAQAEWRTALTEQRLACLGGGAAVLTLLFASIAAALRIDGSTGGKYRQHMFAAAAFVASMGAATLAFTR